MSIAEQETISAELAELLDSIPSPSQHFVICKLCGHQLADAEQIRKILGTNEHEFKNSFGIVHRFRCYEDAPGCSIQGAKEAADTWFVGYTWRVCFCGKCSTFLGWLFEADDSFFGLLNNKTALLNLQEGNDAPAT